MSHRGSVSTVLGFAMMAAAGGGLLAWLARERQAGARRTWDDDAPEPEDMERLLERFAAALPKDEAEWMLRRGRDQLQNWQ